MIRKYREGIKRTLCFFLTAGVFLGGFFHPAFAGEVPEKETEKLAVFSGRESQCHRRQRFRKQKSRKQNVWK